MMTMRAECEMGVGRRSMGLRLSLAGFAMVGLMVTGGVRAGAQAPAPAAAPAALAAPAGQNDATAAASTTDIVGIWQGTLHVPANSNHPAIDLRIENKITHDDKGNLKVVDYSIDQGGRPFAANKASFQNGDFKYAIDQINGSYEGKMSADGKTITGNWTQGDSIPLVLTRVTADAAWPIPEPPKPMAADANPKFDVLTVKPSDPNRPGKLFTIRGRHVMTINTTVSDLVAFGYSIQTKQMENAPAWFDEKYDLDAVPDVEGQPNIQQMRILVRDALVERFGLKFHYEQRELAVYALTVAKGGPKLTVTTDKPSTPGNFLFGGLGRLHVTNSTMKDFCHGMQEAVMDKPVVDQTGLTDRYDFNLNWTPDESQFAAMGAHIPPPNTDDPNAPPSLYVALQEQLGLKLDSTKANADVMVIDHVEKPGAN
ncbi:MAG: TIGR03435 family protein [Terracidiphilus sp.]